MCRTGATGYIGGDALYQLLQRHPNEYDVTALVRNSDKGAQIASQYPSIRLVYGGLDDENILEEEARRADIVLSMLSVCMRICRWLTMRCFPADFADADHEKAARALTRGLATHHPDSPGYIIHTSGTGILLFADIERQIFGESSSKVYNDWDGVDEVTSLPDSAPHRPTDKAIFEASAPNVKPAVVAPPTIHGQGRGPVNQRSVQLPALARITLQKGHGIQVGAGKARWGNVHVHDLSDVYVLLVEAAVAGGGKATWGADAYYITENGEHVMGELGQRVAKAAHQQGFIQSDQVATLPDEEISKILPFGPVLLGGNSRARGIRARKLLGWSPKGKSVEEEIPETVAIEADRLGLVQHHAAKVTG